MKTITIAALVSLMSVGAALAATPSAATTKPAKATTIAKAKPAGAEQLARGFYYR
ncbi:hypothetical protein [Phreatobacter stygius]|uniref:hypothetical protein n=1 Tax=Phreatobacter stygius TaxID=1940610 RepID=UPI00147728BA|nr:hypothetical protein [Phreatobacter stygius]